MKKKVFVLFSLVIILFVFFFPLSFAQEEEALNGEVVIESPMPTSSITPVPDYVMPYPGILPDNPLYGLKTLRDKVISVMIGDPLKKASFDLLQADKRIGAALLLIKTGDRGKQEVALSTISKGQNYYEEAIGKLHEAKGQGTNVSEKAGVMKQAGKQHIYQLQQAKKSLPKQLQGPMSQLITRSEKLLTQVRKFK
jgi:hypothetical protein